MMTVEIFFLFAAFLLFAILQAMMINGIKAATEGRVEVLPDGREKYRGMILFPLVHWLSETRKEAIFYHGATLEEMFLSMAKKYPTVMQPRYVRKIVFHDPLTVSVYTEDECKLMVQYADFLKEKEGIEYLCEMDGEKSIFGFYKIYDEFIFPSYIRKPLFECIKCMASFWGALTFWPVIYAIDGLHLYQVPLFAADVFLLVYLNFYYYKR